MTGVGLDAKWAAADKHMTWQVCETRVEADGRCHAVCLRKNGIQSMYSDNWH